MFVRFFLREYAEFVDLAYSKERFSKRNKTSQYEVLWNKEAEKTFLVQPFLSKVKPYYNEDSIMDVRESAFMMICNGAFKQNCKLTYLNCLLLQQQSSAGSKNIGYNNFNSKHSPTHVFLRISLIFLQKIFL